MHDEISGLSRTNSCCRVSVRRPGVFVYVVQEDGGKLDGLA